MAADSLPRPVYCRLRGSCIIGGDERTWRGAGAVWMGCVPPHRARPHARRIRRHARPRLHRRRWHPLRPTPRAHADRSRIDRRHGRRCSGHDSRRASRPDRVRDVQRPERGPRRSRAHDRVPARPPRGARRTGPSPAPGARRRERIDHELVHTVGTVDRPRTATLCSCPSASCGCRSARARRHRAVSRMPFSHPAEGVHPCPSLAFPPSPPVGPLLFP